MYFHYHLAVPTCQPKALLRRQRGTTYVEFAITSTFSIALLFAIIEFGIAMFDQGLLTQAARVGARTASLYWVNDDVATPQRLSPVAKIRAAADQWTKMAVSFSGDIPVTTICWHSRDNVPTVPPATNLNCSSNSLPASDVVIRQGDLIVVQTRVRFRGPITSALMKVGLDTNLGSRAVMRVE